MATLVFADGSSTLDWRGILTSVLDLGTFEAGGNSTSQTLGVGAISLHIFGTGLAAGGGSRSISGTSITQFTLEQAGTQIFNATGVTGFTGERFPGFQFLLNDFNTHSPNFKNTVITSLFPEDMVIGGSAGPDDLIGGGFADEIAGLGSDDVIDGNAGDDLLQGGDGSDTLVGWDHSDTLFGGDGDDKLFGFRGDGIETPSGNPDKDTLNGGVGNDWLYGSTDADTLNGDVGDDRLDGGAGVDTLNGGDGNDILDGRSGTDILRGGIGNDFYYLSNAFDSVVDSSGYDTIFSSIDRGLGNYLSIERLVLQGTADINGRGNDRSNRLNGNSGDNGLTGGIGDDKLTGGLGDDTYFLEHGNDTVIDSGGTDTIASTISRRLSDYPEIERLVLQGTADSYGYGNNLPNVIFGNTGNNKLNGGNGNDLLVGGGGTDTLTGNANNDFFRFYAASDTGVGTGNRDIIADFTQGSDRIDLSPIDGNGPIAGDPHFVFIGTASFTSGGGRLRYVQIDDADNALDQTVVEGDIDGNGFADFQIQLTGLINLLAGDFIL